MRHPSSARTLDANQSTAPIGENRQRKVPLARPRKTRAKIHRDESRSAPLGHRWNRPVTNLRFASTLGNRQLADAYAPRVTNACGKPPGRHLAPRTARDRLEPSSRDTHMFALRRVATRAFAARAGAQRVALRAFANQCPHDPSKPYHKSPLPLEAAGGLLEYSVVYTDRAMNHMSKPFCKVRARPPNAPSAVPRPARPRPRPRERWKNIPSRCLSTRPPIPDKPRISRRRRKRRARRSRTAREANTARRDVRDARFTAVPRACAHRRSRTRDPRARSPRIPPVISQSAACLIPVRRSRLEQGWKTSARVLLFPCARLAVRALRLRARR